MERLAVAWLVPDRDLTVRAVRSGGPGGQNVNKVATRVEMRLDVRACPSIPAPVRARLLEVLAGRLTDDGILIVTSSRHRTRERNHADALEKLESLLHRALTPQRARRATRPTRASRERRLSDKRYQSGKKALRRGE